jgi:hypothetical protein
MLLVMLMAIGGGVTPPAALAIPGDPDPPGGGDPGPSGCALQVVSPDHAVLTGFVYLVDPPLVRHPTRIRISNPTIQLPDPRCADSRVLTLPVPMQTWSVAAHPAGSTANVTPLGVEAQLVAHRSVSWQVV